MRILPRWQTARVQWRTTASARAFLDVADEHLRADPVAHDLVLSESHYWSELRPARTDGLFGWWEHDGRVTSTFALLPDHPVLCSRLTAAAAAALPPVFPGDLGIGLDARDVRNAQEAFAAVGRETVPRAELSLLRLEAPPPRAPVSGAARRATPADRALLATWFEQFREAHPEDSSDVAFVVDQPLADGGIVLWERDGRTVAMASRTPRRHGVVRMGLVFAPGEGRDVEDAVLRAACATAAREAGTVLALSGSPADTARLQTLGFRACGRRVRLQVAPAPPGG